MVATAKNVGGCSGSGGGGKRARLNAIFVTGRKEFLLFIYFILLFFYIYLCLLILFRNIMNGDKLHGF